MHLFSVRPPNPTSAPRAAPQRIRRSPRPSPLHPKDAKNRWHSQRWAGSPYKNRPQNQLKVELWGPYKHGLKLQFTHLQAGGYDPTYNYSRSPLCSGCVFLLEVDVTRNVEIGMEINRNDFNRKLAANTKIPFLKWVGYRDILTNIKTSMVFTHWL